MVPAMNFPKFWAKGSHRSFTVWRWSDSSLAEAASLAQQAARKVAERFASSHRPERGYGYTDRPFREPVLQELKEPSGDVAAVITRNSYGALVLNTARVMFVDVDLPEPKASGSWLKRLFGKPESAPVDAFEQDAIRRAESWMQRSRGWGWRIYRTRAGLRLLATHAVFDPQAPLTEQVFAAMEADPLYRRLCRAQKCFRARLTPKPWRCGMRKPPARWPWPDAKAEKQFEKWETGYLKVCSDRATCALVTHMGNGAIDPTVQLILDVHDSTTQASSNLSLA
jgi:hypothetical protein